MVPNNLNIKSCEFMPFSIGRKLPFSNFFKIKVTLPLWEKNTPEVAMIVFRTENTNTHGKCSMLLSHQVKSCFLIWDQNPFSDFSRICNSPKSKSKFAVLNNLHFESKYFFTDVNRVSLKHNLVLEGFGNAVCTRIIWA